MQTISDKQYFFAVISMTASVLMLSALLNYIVDPAHLFKKGTYEHGVVNYLLQGKNVAGISNYDERLLQKFYIENLKETKDILVLGSSRSLQIRSGLFDTDSFFNSAVSGASIEDYLSIFSMYQKRELLPEKVILGIDPWVFNVNNNQTRWKAISENYYFMLDLMAIDVKLENNSSDFMKNKIQQLISWGYLKASLRALISKKRDDRKFGFYPTNKESSSVPIKRSDGSLYEASYEKKSLDEVKDSAISFSASPYSLQNFNEINIKSTEILVSFIKYLIELNIDVVIFLAPYHPYVYQTVIENGEMKIVNNVESFLRELAKNHQLSVVGSYNPVISGCFDSEFYDGMHPREVCVNKIFNK
jgi:hypothetical protein